MRILIVGSGAREHVLAWKIAQSPRVTKIFCAPGNAGTPAVAENIALSSDDIESLADFAATQAVDLTIVGPEAPLVAGITALFQARGLRVFGPGTKGAMLEGSKVVSKEFMMRYGVPTARYESHTSLQAAEGALSRFSFPVVVKADGLAAGKGVLICADKADAALALRTIMEEKVFGAAGTSVVIEEYLEGTEASLLCFVSHNRLFPMESARDYKRAHDNDQGLNTGGMGCFSPNPLFTDDLRAEISEKVLMPTAVGLAAEDMDFTGVLFIGLMMTAQGVKVLEYNVRFGDPEAEVVIPRLDSDLLEIIEKCLDGTLAEGDLKWKPEAAVTIVAASGGYPGNYQKGFVISGLDKMDVGIEVFHAGTTHREDSVVTNGGRVLAVTALGDSLAQARMLAYQNLKRISFEGMFWRNDIAMIM